jgi:hypothetical protein
LAGYSRDLNARVQLNIVGGVSRVTVHRTFTTDAGELILVSPSTIPSSTSTTPLVDRFVAWSVGADVLVRAGHHFGMMAGVRTEPLRLRSDLSGQSLRALAGVMWQLQ